MATRPRLVIDTVIIDSLEDPAQSTSTIPGAVLDVNYETGQMARTTQDTEELPLMIRVKQLAGGTFQDVLDSVALVLDALDTIGQEGVVLEYEAGQVCVEIDPQAVNGLTYNSDTIFGSEGVDIPVTIIAARIDSGFDGSGDWQVQRNSAGRIFAVGNLNYSNLSAALADVALMRSGSKRPVWMPSSCKVVEDSLNSGQRQGDIASLAREDYRPVTISVSWEQMALHMANHPAFARVKRAEWDSQVATLPPVDENAGQNHPGFAYSLTGSLEFKSEQNTTYDPADPSATGAGTMHSDAVACAEAMIDEAEQRLGIFVLITGDLDRGVTGADGVYRVDVKGIAFPSNFGASRFVTSWNETLLVEHSFKGQFTDTTDGGRFEWEHPGGDEITVTHTLVTTSLGGSVGYVRPQSLPASEFRRVYKAGDNAQPKNSSDNDTAARRFNTGAPTREYRSNYTRRYVHVPKGSGPSGKSGKTSSSFGGGQGHAGQFG